MFGVQHTMHHEYQLCMDTTNLKLNDNTNKNAAEHRQVQIEEDEKKQQQQNLINLNTSASLFSASTASIASTANPNAPPPPPSQALSSAPPPDYNQHNNVNYNHHELTATPNTVESYTPPSPVLITNLDQSRTKIEQQEVQNDTRMTMNQDTQPTGEQQQRSSSNVSTKICKVCGDKSLGYNFSQVTCESCKAFFRRNALRNKNFKCPFTDNCEIDVVTRRFCQKCRLRKCFAIGMKSEWILSDEEKRMKRHKIEENKKKRRTKHLSSSSATYSPSAYSVESAFFNGQSNAYSTVTTALPLPPSALVPLPMTHLNPIVYDSQIDDSSMMQSPSAYGGYAQSAPFYGGQEQQQHFQQPEIVNQLVHSHYEQYKSNVDYDPIANWDTNSSPQYSSSLNSNTPALVDTFFSDTTSSPSTFNSNSINSGSIRSPINTLSTVSNGVPNEISLTHYSSSDTTGHTAGSTMVPKISSKFLSITCLPENQMIEAIFEQAAEAKLQDTTCESLSCSHSAPSDRDSLSNSEMELINELKFATSNVGCVMNALTTGESIAPENVIFELLRMTDYAVRKSVTVAKKLAFFRNLCEEDQISALKGSSTEMMMCRTISLYDEATDSIIKHDFVGKPKIRLDVLKSIREEIYCEHKEMILSFKKELRQDTTLVSILMAILLFQHERPHIQHRTTMKYIQTIYRSLLKRYIYVNFSKQNIPIYESLLQSLAKLKSLNEKYIKTYVQLNADILGPLLMEVFDFGS